MQQLYQRRLLTSGIYFVVEPNTKRIKLPIRWWWWYKRRTNMWRLVIKKYLQRVYRSIHNTNLVAMFAVCKPKNQFFINLRTRKFYSYSTGLVLKAINHPSRSFRRSRLGIKLLFNFMIKQLPRTSKIYNWVYILKTLNNYNTIKFHILKCIDQQAKPGTLLVHTRKNYTHTRYKKLSYINKRIRRKYFIE